VIAKFGSILGQGVKDLFEEETFYPLNKKKNRRLK